MSHQFSVRLGLLYTWVLDLGRFWEWVFRFISHLNISNFTHHIRDIWIYHCLTCPVISQQQLIPLLLLFHCGHLGFSQKPYPNLSKPYSSMQAVGQESSHPKGRTYREFLFTQLSLILQGYPVRHKQIKTYFSC